MALIELDQVSRRYSQGGARVCALDAVSLRIEAGEMLAIMGASGSGKSTLMNLVGCLDRPTSGCVRIDGHDLARLSADEAAALRRETFGFVFQRYHLLPHLDALGNVELPAVYAGRGRRQRRQRALALLRRLGVGDRVSHKPNALSGGQQQRVSIARALMNGGRIILADEPTGALDSASGAELLALLAELNAMGHTVIIVTHDPDVAAHARRVVELRDGRIVRDELRPGARRAASSLAAPARPGAARGAALALAPWREAVAMSLAALNSARLRSALSMLGISIGIAAVATIMALSDSVRSHMHEVLSTFTTNKITALSGNPKLPPGAVPQAFTPRDVQALRQLPGVSAVVPTYMSQVPGRHAQRDAIVNAFGVGVGDMARDREVVVQGRDIGALDLDTHAHVAVLNEKARDQLFAPGETAVGQSLMVGALAFTVVGVAGSRQPAAAGAGAVYLPATTYTTELNTSPQAAMLDVFFDDADQSDALVAQVARRLRAVRGGVDDFELLDGVRLRHGLDGTISGIGRALGAIAGISLLVGGVGVMNIMLVSVSERTREIGIRMAIGARQRDVRRQFLIESVVLCCIGGLAGLALPWLVAQGLALAGADLGFSISWRALASGLGTCLGIGLLFGNMPANSAARLSPLDALSRD